MKFLRYIDAMDSGTFAVWVAMVGCLGASVGAVIAEVRW